MQASLDLPRRPRQADSARWLAAGFRLPIDNKKVARRGAPVFRANIRRISGQGSCAITPDHQQYPANLWQQCQQNQPQHREVIAGWL